MAADSVARWGYAMVWWRLAGAWQCSALQMSCCVAWGYAWWWLSLVDGRLLCCSVGLRMVATRWWMADDSVVQWGYARWWLAGGYQLWLWCSVGLRMVVTRLWRQMILLLSGATHGGSRLHAGGIRNPAVL